MTKRQDKAATKIRDLEEQLKTHIASDLTKIELGDEFEVNGEWRKLCADLFPLVKRGLFGAKVVDVPRYFVVTPDGNTTKMGRVATLDDVRSYMIEHEYKRIIK